MSATDHGPEAAFADLLDLARSAALAAGRLLLEQRPDTLVREVKSSPTDVVTQMDRASEDLLVRVILGARPADGVLGEEGGERPGSSGVRWIVDPLDGTTNYLYGLPQWAVSVGVEQEGRVVAGVVEVPALGRRYFATLGGGAWEERADGAPARPLHVTGLSDLSQALVSTGFGYSSEQRSRQAEDLRRLAPRVRDIRRMGAAAIDLAWVAAGYVDAYYESALHEWDLAAGGLIAQEAGAVVQGRFGAPASGDLVLAATPGIFAELYAAVVG